MLQNALLTLGQLLTVHVLLVMALFPGKPWFERLGQYPVVMQGILRPEVQRWLWPELLLTGTYLLGGLLLAWFLAAWMGRWRQSLLWANESLPPYLLMLLLVWAGLAFSLWRGVTFPLLPGHPVMVGMIMLGLAWGVAARAASLPSQAREEALRADYTRTARGMGLPERTVLRQAGRVALPQRTWSLAGETLGLSLSLIIMESMLDFPGLGREANVAMTTSLAGQPIYSAVNRAFTEPLLAVQIIGLALFLLLGLAFVVSLALSLVARRLDPRPLAGQETR